MKKSLLFLSFIFIAFVTNAQQGIGTFGLVINEVDYDVPSTDTTEFIELKNTGSVSIALSGYAIILHNGANATNYDTIFLASYTLNPGQYYVICGSGNYVPNCNQTETALSDFIQNGAPDGMAIWQIGTANYIDALSYEGDCVAPFLEGTGVVNGDNNTSNQLGLSRYPDGTDTQNNDVDFSKHCTSPGATNAITTTNCDGTVGIEDESKNSFSIYPNPSNEVVNISTGTDKGDVTLSVYDFTGKRIDSRQLKNNAGVVQYNTAQFAEGVYILSVTIADKTVTKKLTVLHR